MKEEVRILPEGIEEDIDALAQNTKVKRRDLMLAIEETCQERGMNRSDAFVVVAASLVQYAGLEEQKLMKILYAMATAMGEDE